MRHEDTLANVLLIGAMKAGTTSLFDWLASQPGVFGSRMKEPNFFTDETRWRRGLDWYRALFPREGHAALRVEASVAYTDPRRCEIAASRIAQVLPGAKLLFVARDPEARLRSHYRHEVLRGRERRPFIEALHASAPVYVARSMYWRSLAPFVDLFPREQIHVARFESLFGDDDAAWIGVLAFLGLDPGPRPGAVRNRTSERPQFGPVMKALWEAGLRRPPRAVPGFVRGPLRRVLLREVPDALVQTAHEPIPERFQRPMWGDAERLRTWLGRDAPLWPPPASSGVVTAVDGEVQGRTP